MEATLDGGEIPLYQPLLAKQGQVLHFGEARVGMRAYLLIAGGFDMPKTLGSAATFSMGDSAATEAEHFVQEMYYV